MPAILILKDNCSLFMEERMLKGIVVLSWIAVFMLAAISLVLILLENWAGVLVSLVLAPAIWLAMQASEEAGL